MRKNFKRYFLWYTIVPLLIITIGASYYRFMVSYDYTVRYERECDPYSQSCFVYCENESCTDPFYYSWIDKKASTIVSECGKSDITLCDAAYVCEAGSDCSVTFCDTETDSNCEYLEEEDRNIDQNLSDQVNNDL